MSTDPIRLVVLLGSNREGRFGPTVAGWLLRHLASRPDFEVDFLDLADQELPVVFPAEPSPAVRAFVSRLDRADAFAVVTPEYNHGYPASLKQAIDLANPEWHAKPVGFVSYGGISGGLRAVEQLRQVFAELHATTIRDTVSFHSAPAQFDAEGDPIDPTAVDAAAKTMLDHLAWWAEALRTARSERPYAS